MWRWSNERQEGLTDNGFRPGFGKTTLAAFCFAFTVFFFGFGVIGSELRALYMLDKCSTAEPRPQLLASFWKVGLNWVSLELNQEEKVDLDEK